LLYGLQLRGCRAAVEEDANPAPKRAGGGGVEPATGATGGFHWNIRYYNIGQAELG